MSPEGHKSVKRANNNLRQGREDIEEKLVQDGILDELYRAIVCGVLTVRDLSELLSAVVSATRYGLPISRITNYARSQGEQNYKGEFG